MDGPLWFLPPFTGAGQPRDTFNGRGMNGVHMRHFIPLQDSKGTWCVAYANHRGECVSVMECGSFAAAYAEAAAMTLDDTKQAICENRITQQGNRYLRRFA